MVGQQRHYALFSVGTIVNHSPNFKSLTQCRQDLKLHRTLNSGFVKWKYAVVITTTTWCHWLHLRTPHCLKLFCFLRNVLKMFYLPHVLFCVLPYSPNFFWFHMAKQYVKHDFDDVRCFACDKRQHTTILIYRVEHHEGVLGGTACDSVKSPPPLPLPPLIQ